jgi:hypothetical protein
MVRRPARNNSSQQRVLNANIAANIAALLQVMQLDVLQHISFFQSLIDCAGIRKINKLPPLSLTRSLFHPLVVRMNS